MRPSDITDGITGVFVKNHGMFQSFNEAVGYYRRNPVAPLLDRVSAVHHVASMRPSDITDGIPLWLNSCRSQREAPCRCFNEAVGYYRRNRDPQEAAAGADVGELQ